MNIEKLEALAKTPREINEDLIKIHGKPFFFLRKAIRTWEHGLRTGPVVFGFVVQANQILFEPGEGEMAPAVLMYTEDPRYCRDVDWLAELGARVAELRDSGSNDMDLSMLGALLAAEESEFDRLLPLSFTGGVPVRVYTDYLETYKLPSGCIGEDRVVPLFVLEKDNALVIPGELYC